MEPKSTYEEGLKLLPSWKDSGPEADARYEQGRAQILLAAEAGYLPAMVMMAGGIAKEASFSWAVRLAKLGELTELDTALTDGDHPVEEQRQVLAAARAGEPWAQVAVGMVYGNGMQDMATGKMVATQPDGYGWLPAVQDPEKESEKWLETAAGSGWAPALLHLAYHHRLKAPQRALEALQKLRIEALSEDGQARVRRLLPELLERANAPVEVQFPAYQQLADAGDADAMAWLAARYQTGEGVPADAVQARQLYERAAAGGSVDGLRELGKLKEAEGDEAGARAAYEQAAELGNDDYARDRLAEHFGLSWYARKKKKPGKKKKS
jgi:TPR repeat protein